MKKLFFLIALFLIAGVNLSLAQLNITNAPPYNTANYLIQNVFADNSVNITNVQVYGAPQQYGYFNNGAAGVGIDSGIVLGTWQLSDITTSTTAPTWGVAPPANINNTTGLNFGFPWMGTSTSNNLLDVSAAVPALLGASFAPTTDANSACAISFEFEPTQDTMKFKFVFSSDEWDVFPCTQFNDVFGFFVSGPGITGPYSAPAPFTNAANVAVVPGTNIPITISSITSPTNTGSCSQSYNSSFYASANTGGLSLNARTTVIEAVFPVQSCQTYHFTMAIANAGDVGLQSAVFMEANSFGGTQPFTATILPQYNTFGGDSVIYEGCSGIELLFERNDTLLAADSIDLVVFGNATPGVDTDPIPDSLYFAQGQDSLSLYFNIPNDFLIEGPETLYIAVNDTGIQLGCGNFNGDTLRIIIQDAPLIAADPTIDTAACTDLPVTLQANPLTGIGPYYYQWSTSATDTLDSITVNVPTQTTDYYVTITDACSIYTYIDTATLVIQNPNTMIQANDDTLTCESFGSFVDVNVINPMPGLTYQWSSGQTTASFFQTNPFVTTDYIVTVSQACAGYTLIDTFTIVVDNPPFTTTTQDDTIFCAFDQVPIWVDVSYTTPNFDFQWNNGVNDSDQVVSPTATTDYIVSVTDACGQNTVVDTVTVYLKTYDPLVVDTIPDDTLLCSGDLVNLGPPVVSGGSGDFDVSWDNWASTTNTITDNPLATTTYTIQVADNCNLDSTQYTVTMVIPIYDSLIVAPFDTIICEDPVGTLTIPARTTGGTGVYSFDWSNGASSPSIVTDAVGGTVYSVTVTDECGLKDDMVANVTYLGAPIFNLQRFYTDSNGVDQTVDFEDQLIVDYSPLNILFRADGAVVPPDSVSWDLWFNGSSADAAYGWPVLNTSDPDVEFSYEDEGLYQVRLIVTSEEGCADTAFALHEVKFRGSPPNVFTPNGDGVNDIFRIPGSEALRDFNCVIYNRWGRKVFEWTDPYSGWDGSGFSDGVYYYIVTGKRGNGDAYQEQGNVTLIKGN